MRPAMVSIAICVPLVGLFGSGRTVEPVEARSGVNGSSRSAARGARDAADGPGCAPMSIHDPAPTDDPGQEDDSGEGKTPTRFWVAWPTLQAERVTRVQPCPRGRTAPPARAVRETGGCCDPHSVECVRGIDRFRADSFRHRIGCLWRHAPPL